MADYIVCPNKRSAPRMNVLVCRERCPLVEDCPAYSTFEKVLVEDDSLPFQDNSENISATAP